MRNWCVEMIIVYKRSFAWGIGVVTFAALIQKVVG